VRGDDASQVEGHLGPLRACLRRRCPSRWRLQVPAQSRPTTALLEPMKGTWASSGRAYDGPAGAEGSMARLYRGLPDGPCRRGLRRHPPELMRPFSSVGPTTAPTGNDDTGHTGHHSQRLRSLLRDREIMLLKDTKTCPRGKGGGDSARAARGKPRRRREKRGKRKRRRRRELREEMAKARDGGEGRGI